MGFGQVGIVLFSLIVLSGLGWSSYCDYQSVRKLNMAKESFVQGYPRVASELSKEVREKFKLTKEECDLILSIDSRLRDANGLFLNAEKCLYSGFVSSPNPYLAISLAFELNEDKASAKKILLQAVEKVQYHQSFFFRLAYLSYGEEKKDESKNILNNLIARNKEDEKIIVSSIQFFTQKNDWEMAYQFISYLEGLKTISFESQITLYGVAKKNGDDERAKKYLAQINQVLSKLPKEEADKIKLQLNKI